MSKSKNSLETRGTSRRDFLASSVNSWMISPIRGNFPRRISPFAQTRTSLEPLPPRTGRFWTRATRQPMRAAEIAAPMPA